MSADQLTVYIADDQPVFRLGLQTVLSKAGDITVLGDSPLSDEAVELVSAFQPKVAIVGVSPPRHRALDFCRRLGQRCPGLPVILMTLAEDGEELFESIRSGAWCYISKQAEIETALEAIRKVARGEMPVQDTIATYPQVGRRLLEEFQAMARNPRLKELMAPLSQREMELLRQLGQGRSNKEIAHILDITAQTVKNHITSILRKLDVNDRTQAVLMGLRYGWISLGGMTLDSEGLGTPAIHRN